MEKTWKQGISKDVSCNLLLIHKDHLEFLTYPSLPTFIPWSLSPLSPWAYPSCHGANAGHTLDPHLSCLQQLLLLDNFKLLPPLVWISLKTLGVYQWHLANFPWLLHLHRKNVVSPKVLSLGRYFSPCMFSPVETIPKTILGLLPLLRQLFTNLFSSKAKCLQWVEKWQY